MLKKVSLFAAFGYTLALGTVSLITLNNVPDIGVSFADKIFHFLAYAIFAVLWYAAFFYGFYFKKKKALLYAVILAVVFGMIIEVLQGTWTVSRAFDVYDALANTAGAVVAAIVIQIKNSLGVKNS